MGDVVHALALANGLRHGFPDAEITWVIHPVPYEVVRRQPAVDRFVVFARRGGWGGLRRELAGLRFDVVLVPQVSLKASLVAALARSPVKVGFDFHRSRELHWFFTNRHLPPHPPQHVQDHYLEFLEYLGIRDYTPRWDIVFTAEEEGRREEFFTAVGAPVVAFVLASSDPAKDWTPEGYAAAVDHVERRMGLRALLLGGPSRREAAMAEAVTERCTSRPLIALDRPVRDTLIKLAGSRVVVAPDTGPLHAAVALGTPTVGLYGLSNPRRCGPYRRFHDLLVDHFTDPGDADRPPLRRTKKGRMEGIGADEVIAMIERAVDRYGAGEERGAKGV